MINFFNEVDLNGAALGFESAKHTLKEMLWLYPEMIEKLKEMKSYHADILLLERENDIMKEALEWYAQPEPYGQVAREALAKLEGENDKA